MTNTQYEALLELLERWDERSEEFDHDETATDQDYAKAYTWGEAADELREIFMEVL